MIFTANLLPELRRDKASGGFISSVFGNDNNDCFVYGPFTSDNVDVVGDIVTKDGTIKAVGRWNNIRNVRFMHQPMPVGVATKLSYIDGLPWNEAETKIIDDNTAKLARAGALKGYSIGARVLEWGPIEDEEDDFFFFFGPMKILDYDLAEISVVDNPTNRDALWSSVKGMKMVGDRPRHTILTPNDIVSVVPMLGREKAMLLREEAAIVDYLVKHQTAGLNSRLWSEFAKPVTYSLPGVDKMKPEIKEEIILESVVILEEAKAVDATLVQEQAMEEVVTKELEVSSNVADVTNISDVPGIVYSTTGTSDGVGSKTYVTYSDSGPVAYDDTELRRTVEILTVRIEELGNAVSQAMEKIASDIAGMHGAIKVQIDANEAAVTKINDVATNLEASLDELRKPISRTSKIDNPVASQDKPVRNSNRLSVL